MLNLTEKKNKTKNLEGLENAFFKASKNLLATEELEPMQNLISSLMPSQGNQGILARAAQTRIFSFCSDRFPNSLSAKLLRVYARNDPGLEDNLREIAIRGLRDVLSNHKKESEPLLHLYAIQELVPLLISCLEERGIREDTFKILAEATYHVAVEIFDCHESEWVGLRRYICSRAETEFKKAVYVFQLLSMPLEESEFVAPLMGKLIPQILKWLDLDPSGSQPENNWVLAFNGAFCAAVHLLGTVRVDLVVNVAYKMLSSVSELVRRGMELGFVRRAFMDVEMIVTKQSTWYWVEEYKFVSGLIRRMNEIKGMKNSTKMVLWRTRMVMEKNARSSSKERDNGDDDWLNLIPTL